VTFKFTLDETEAIPANPLIGGGAGSRPAMPPPPASVSKLAALAPPPSPFVTGGWGERQIAVFQARRERCLHLGFGDGELFAEILVVRDADQDDRTLCVECIHCRKSGCAKNDAWLPRLLQRCDRFKAAVLEIGDAS
jgi:hypothetical protein